ncbi:MAG: TRAM domain-containing protein [Methanocellales archaeon]|nr:TRAM domain-containing protein [Methanocellales archaeon]MDD4897839.1 TRAM domain-containing protein [Methanocellales archaeon]
MYRKEPSAPVADGETYDVKIEDIAREGDGIARIEGFVVFVPNTKLGDEVKIKINKVMHRFATAELVSEESEESEEEE